MTAKRKNAMPAMKKAGCRRGESVKQHAAEDEAKHEDSQPRDGTMMMEDEIDSDSRRDQTALRRNFC